MTVLVDTFLARLKQRITVPANQVLLSNDQMLGMADDVTKERIVPLILSCNQNFFVYAPEEIEGVEDQEVYDIPYRSIGRGLRDLKVRWGGEENGLTNMTQIALEDAHEWQNNGGLSAPYGFYFRGDKFVVVPLPDGDDYTLFVYYNMQPNDLIQNSDACLVTAVSGADVTVSSIPSDYIAGAEIDFIKGKSGCSTMAFDVEIAGAGGNTLTFNSADDVPEDLQAGDWISIAKTTPVIQLPDEAVPLLELWTAERICYAIGDFDGAQVLANRSTDIAANLKMVLSPRIEGAQTKIINRNGLLRGRRGYGWGWWNGNGGF